MQVHHNENQTSKSETKAEPHREEDPDLQRVYDLVDLHNGVKVRHLQLRNQQQHGQGHDGGNAALRVPVDPGLQKARADVAAVRKSLMGR